MPKNKHKYICNECEVEMKETTLAYDMQGKRWEGKISLACEKCRKWAVVSTNEK